MPAPLTYATAFDYLLSLGRRFSLIGRAELTFTGEASAAAKYPLLLIEADPQGSETIGNGGVPTGADTFTIAVQVLTQQPDPTPADLQAMLVQTNGWADSLTQQLRDERPQQLAGVNKLSIPGTAGTALACGWRVELQLKIVKDLNRTTNRDLFAPEA
ncbi:MAG: hypothetical protein EOO59_10585 [Hymenobacter sp.]|nr:MAG: hypothetical protein EOO59_10585 [Hymenobacter sp.]